MAIKVSRIKEVLWGAAALLTALSFPVQVYANSPLPALIPFGIIGAIIALNRFFPPADNGYGEGFRRSGTIDTIVALYGAMVVFDCAWQAGLGLISPTEAVSALVNYLLPVAWFRYFRRHGSEREIRAVIVGAAVAGVVVAAFFAFDSYMKLGLLQVSPYATKAFEYSVNRAGGADVADLSTSRIALGARSFGLLETHSVSGAWVILGTFAALTLTPRRRVALRRAIVLGFGSMLLVGLNFTSIVVFIVAVLLLEFGGYEFLTGRLSSRTASNAAWLAAVMSVLVVGVLWAVGDVFAEFLLNIVVIQRNLALGTGGSDLTMVGITINNVRGYLVHLAEYPLSALWGDGYSSYGGAKGGDIGWVETLSRMGIPLFALIAVGLLRLMVAGLHEARSQRFGSSPAASIPDRHALLEFSVSAVLMALIMDLHYSVWAAKSILPLLFFSIALLSRLLSANGLVEARAS